MPQGKARLVLASFLAQLLALLIINLVASEIRLLGFLQNYLYACAFFGLAIGCLKYSRGCRKLGDGDWLIWFTALVSGLALCHLSKTALVGFADDGSSFFLFAGKAASSLTNELFTIAAVLLSFLLPVKCLESVGASIAAESDKSGKLSPLLIFSGAALAWLGWCAAQFVTSNSAAIFIVIIIASIALLGLRLSSLLLAGFALVCVLGLGFCMVKQAPGVPLVDAGKCQSFSTPFCQVETIPYSVNGKEYGFSINLNGNFLQPAVDVSTPFGELGRQYGSSLSSLSDYYSVPYKACAKPARVLILGAGAGNDAAFALLNGAKDIYAVEPSSWLLSLGGRHPQKPYSSLQVHKCPVDEREFFRTSNEEFDLIIYGALEAQTAFSPFGALRSDNYELTAESMHEAISHLHKGGCLVISFDDVRRWYGLRLAHNLVFAGGRVDAYIKTPYRSYLIFTPSGGENLSDRLKEGMPADYVHDPAEITHEMDDVCATTDEWPFAFTMAPSLPRPYLVCLILLIFVAIGMVHSLPEDNRAKEEGQACGKPGRAGVAMFCLATAFMLSSDRSLSTLALTAGALPVVAHVAGAFLFLLAAAGAAFNCFSRPSTRVFFWLAYFAFVGFDFLFNYEAISSIRSSSLEAAAAYLLPLLPVLPAGALIGCLFTGSISYSRLTAWLFFGMAFALVLDAIAIYAGPVWLDVASAIFTSGAWFLIEPWRKHAKEVMAP
jgi:hypothetical protein